MSAWNETSWFWIASAARSVAVLALAWIAARLLRKHSAATRHLVWTAALAAILVLPILSLVLPAWRVPVAGALLAPAGVTFESTAAASGGPAAALSATVPPSRPVRSNRWRPDWRMGLLLLWAAGAALACARTLLAYAAAWRARRSARLFPGANRFAALPQSMGIRRPVEILEIKAGSMPMTFGLRRSAILLPADAVGWGEEKCGVVLLHEMAHVRRGDAATHLLARAAVALYWWNPLAWIAWREFVKERERAADDLVLNAGTRASAYAGYLLEFARSMRAQPAMAWAAAAIARRSQLEGRLLAILDSGVDRATPARKSILAVAAAALAIIAPLAAVRAQEASTEGMPADVDVAIRLAQSQKNYGALDAAAKAATRLGNYDTAKKLLEASLALRAQLSGDRSVEYAAGLVQLAEVEQKHDPKSGGDLYAKAASILGDRPEAARALTHLGVIALAKPDYPAAFEYFQRAQLSAPTHAAQALMWMAIVRQREQNTGEAERLYRDAMAAADPHSAVAPVVTELFADFLRLQDRQDEAGEVSRRADTLRKENALPLPALPDDVYRIGNGVTPPSLTQKVEPSYSEEARAARLQGKVVVRTIIGTDGRTHDSQIVRGLGLGLDENAIETISRWQFKPGAKDGQPVKVTATIEVNFRLL